MKEQDIYKYLTEEEIEQILEDYGDINNYIKDQVYENKKETTKFMDAVKFMFFTYLLYNVGKKAFSKDLKKEFDEYERKTVKQVDRTYKIVADLTKYENKGIYTIAGEKMLKNDIKDVLKQYKIDNKSTKTANDIYFRKLENYYSKTEKTLTKGWIDKQAYLSQKVSKFDKVEKTVKYNRLKKDGEYVRFDLASYNSMVYNTNLTNTGWIQTIKDSAEINEDVVYVEAHMFACDLCRALQGKFYSITGQTQFYEGHKIDSLEDAVRQGLKHPNCTHIPHPVTDEDKITKKYSSESWHKKYESKQKKQSLELKKRRLLSDNKIYKELGDYDSIDKNKQKIRKLNEKIKQQKEIMNKK